MKLDVTIDQEGVLFRSYPFVGASVFPSGRIGWHQVRSIDGLQSPPALRLGAKEIVFVPVAHADRLHAFATARGIPSVRDADPWGLLLEPFLDTEHSAEDHERVVTLLSRFGLGREEVAAIRQTVEKQMISYNAIHWEWIHLGLWDLLWAHAPDRLERLIPRRSRNFIAFYGWAMEIATREAVK